MFFQKQIDAAHGDYTLAIRYGSPDLYAAYFNRELVNEVVGRIGDARTDYEKALELKSDLEAARSRLSELSGAAAGGRAKEVLAGG